MASSISYLCCEKFLRTQEKNSMDMSTSFSPLGCDFNAFHQGVKFFDIISVSSMIMSEIFEFSISDGKGLEVSRDTKGSISKTLSGIFGFGGSSSHGASTSAPSEATQHSQLSSNADVRDRLLAWKRNMAVWKLEFARVLVEMGMIDFALKYLLSVRETVGIVGAAGKMLICV